MWPANACNTFILAFFEKLLKNVENHPTASNKSGSQKLRRALSIRIFWSTWWIRPVHWEFVFNDSDHGLQDLQVQWGVEKCEHIFQNICLQHVWRFERIIRHTNADNYKVWMPRASVHNGNGMLPLQAKPLVLPQRLTPQSITRKYKSDPHQADRSDRESMHQCQRPDTKLWESTRQDRTWQWGTNASLNQAKAHAAMTCHISGMHWTWIELRWHATIQIDRLARQ